MYITEVDMEVEGDTTFPDIDKNRWSIQEEIVFKGGKFLTYERVKILTT